MKRDLMGILMLLLSASTIQAAQLEQPSHVPTLRTREVVTPRNARPPTTSARKAEITRRMFWLAMSLR